MSKARPVKSRVVKDSFDEASEVLTNEKEHPKDKRQWGLEIDWIEFDKLCALQCPITEIAGWYNCSIATIEEKVKAAHGVRFREYYEQKRGVGKVALRRAQFNMALKNPTMAIWLGKNWLEQCDKGEVTTTAGVSAEVTLALQSVLKELIKLKQERYLGENDLRTTQGTTVRLNEGSSPGDK